jgi:hypothetical protein
MKKRQPRMTAPKTTLVCVDSISNISVSKYSLLRNFKRYFNAVIIPPANLPPHQLQCLRIHTAWMLAAGIVKQRRVPPGYNRLSIAHDLVEVIKAAPLDKPFALTRLDAERLVVDALHVCNARKGGAA